MDFQLLQSLGIIHAFWNRPTLLRPSKSDNRFELSVIGNPYFAYLIVPNGSGLVYLGMVHFGTIQIYMVAL